jgi:hypothetical protein
VHFKLARAGLGGADVGMDDGVSDRLADGQRDAPTGFCGGAGGGGKQVELAPVETHERAHAARPVVLDKLRYMRGGEALARADAETVKAVRDYERKLQRRQSALDETARVLPTSRASAGEERLHEEKVGAPVWVVDH